MSETISILDRVTRDLAPPTDSFDRLRRRRRRRTLRTRSVAALLAALTGTTSIVVAGSLIGRNEPPPVTVPLAFHALWPERDRPAAEAAQARADDGDPTIAWRLDPERTAERFVLAVLNWRAAYLGGAIEPSDDSVALGISNCPFQVGGVFCLSSAHVWLRLDRLVERGPEGIWSVTAADFGVPNGGLPVDPGGTIEFGAVLDARSHFPADEEIQMGWRCGMASGSMAQTAVLGRLRLRAPTRSDCGGSGEPVTGYVYAARPYDRLPAHLWGEAVFDPDHPPSLPGPIRGLVAVPVTFITRPAASDPPPREYVLDLPDHADRSARPGEFRILIPTNLPEATRVFMHLSSRTRSWNVLTQVTGGRVVVDLTGNLVCDTSSGLDIGPRWTISLVVAPLYDRELFGGDSRGEPLVGSLPQSEAVIDELGDRFQYVIGPQVTTADRLDVPAPLPADLDANVLAAVRTYILPASACG